MSTKAPSALTAAEILTSTNRVLDLVQKRGELAPLDHANDAELCAAVVEYCREVATMMYELEKSLWS